MKITAIKAQVKNPDRVSIYVDGKYTFSLDVFQLSDLGIRNGLEVTDEKIEEFKNESSFGKAYMRALELIMRRSRSERELRDYAWRKQWPPEQTVRIIERLKARGYLNDQKFAESWIRSRQLTKPISNRRLKMELKQKGVTEEIIATTLQNSGYDELDALRQMITKKQKLARYKDDQQKLMQYLARQGFSFDDIKTALQNPAD